MGRNRNQSGGNIEDPTDAEVSAAIHYLDSDPHRGGNTTAIPGELEGAQQARLTSRLWAGDRACGSG